MNDWANRDQITDRLRSILISELQIGVPKDAIALEHGFATVLGVDSLGFLELRYQCEETFGIAISDEDFTPVHFRSCGTLTDFITSRLSVRGAP